jgi:hypothetical protein
MVFPDLDGFSLKSCNEIIDKSVLIQTGQTWLFIREQKSGLAWHMADLGWQPEVSTCWAWHPQNCTALRTRFFSGYQI